MRKRGLEAMAAVAAAIPMLAAMAGAPPLDYAFGDVPEVRLDLPAAPRAPAGVQRGGGTAGRWRGDFANYRWPYLGAALPTYWYSPTWWISDWARWGLRPPGAGNGWYRYYDDAVLVDARGTVRDWRSGIDWDRRGLARPSRRSALARAYDRGYDDGYGAGYDDGVDYAEDAVAYRGAWRRGPAPLPGGVRVETYRAGRLVRGATGGTQVYGRPDGSTVVVVPSAQ